MDNPSFDTFSLEEIASERLLFWSGAARRMSG